MVSWCPSGFSLSCLFFGGSANVSFFSASILVEWLDALDIVPCWPFRSLSAFSIKCMLYIHGRLSFLYDNFAPPGVGFRFVRNLILSFFHQGYRTSWMSFWINTWNDLSGSWIVDLFYVSLYLLVGFYYFLRSITRILIFQVGFLTPPSPTLNRSVFHAPTSVTALTSEQLEAHSKCMDFSPGQDTVIIDNCANAHIWNKRHHFTNFREFRSKEQVVSTIGGKQHFPLGIGSVKVSWRDDNDVIFRHTLQNVLFFPDSPVCIISSHRLACE